MITPTISDMLMLSGAIYRLAEAINYMAFAIAIMSASVLIGYIVALRKAKP